MEFDSYMLSPEHKDKMNVLRAMGVLIEYRLIGEDEKMRMIEFVVTPDKKDSAAQKARLEEYCRKLMNLK